MYKGDIIQNDNDNVNPILFLDVISLLSLFLSFASIVNDVKRWYTLLILW